MINVTIDGKKLVLRHSFKLPNPTQKIDIKEVEKNPEKFAPELQALLEIKGQNVLVTQEVIDAEKKAAAERKKANSKTKK